ncbi:DMT family transporter [Variovorax terrae]|uniref:DMT family transporter n=1 Tax=Variovorax terrae TaxID=2923278 RepID=A0A9X1VZE6_9BURK|nr:DMT family transporter [Variovorax terrae]MCJ0764882.1 DMT family transporter [Variovorax terrae]
MTASPLFPRPFALGTLLLIGVCFGSNHIAARLAFDHGTGLVTAILMRSGLTAVALLGVVLWLRLPLRPPVGSRRWLLALGLLIALQSLLLYSAVARIPVALALLAFNTFPVLYALLSWALGGRPPSRRAAALMGLILLGLALALDAPARLGLAADAGGPSLALGVALALGGSLVFAVALWITEHRLPAVPGPLRSLCTMALVCLATALGGLVAGQAGLLPGALHWPADGLGWLGLLLLTLLYGCAFSVLFVLMPRLEMARNASALNIEPIAVLALGWLLLDQALRAPQVLGALLVVAGIVLLARTGAKP